jgi:thiol-disulfide isomerase/thioredoxin
MTQRSRDARREAARARERTAKRNRWVLPVVGAVIVAAAAVGAIVLSGGGSGGGASVRPSGDLVSPGASAAGGNADIAGQPLVAFVDPANDPAVGQTIPTVTSPTASIALDGRPKVLMFIAHWCPHCQREVPLIQSWINAGGPPADVDLISISTGIDPSRPNYPPEAWLEREGWTPPVVVDPTNEIANAYGLSAYPFFVFVNADGTVQSRRSGELTTADLEATIGELAR